VTWIVARCICRPTAARTVLKVGDPLAPALMRAASGFDNCRTPRKKSLTQIMRANHTSRPHGRHTHRAEAGRQGEGGRRPAVPVGCRGWLRCDLGWLWLCVVPHPPTANSTLPIRKLRRERSHILRNVDSDAASSVVECRRSPPADSDFCCFRALHRAGVLVDRTCGALTRTHHLGRACARGSSPANCLGHRPLPLSRCQACRATAAAKSFRARAVEGAQL
jgi:hypothetical protein